MMAGYQTLSFMASERFTSSRILGVKFSFRYERYNLD